MSDPFTGGTGLALQEVAKKVRRMRPGPRCLIARLRETLPADDVELLNGWLASDETGAWIARALREAGINVSQSTVNYHRRGDCACEAP